MLSKRKSRLKKRIEKTNGWRKREKNWKIYAQRGKRKEEKQDRKKWRMGKKNNKAKATETAAK